MSKGIKIAHSDVYNDMAKDTHNDEQSRRNAAEFGWHFGFYTILTGWISNSTDNKLPAAFRSSLEDIKTRFTLLLNYFNIKADITYPTTVSAARKITIFGKSDYIPKTKDRIEGAIRIQFDTSVSKLFSITHLLALYGFMVAQEDGPGDDIRLKFSGAIREKMIEALYSDEACNAILDNHSMLLQPDWVIDQLLSKHLDKVPPASNSVARRFLFLAANPTDTIPLDLEQELRGMITELRGVRFRELISFVAHHAVQPDDLIRHVRTENPIVIHFSGHGSGHGIVLRSDDGGINVVTGNALRKFLENRGVILVVLNSCYSKDQAEVLLKSVKVVIGTTINVDDEAARRFAVAFYRSLGNGLSVGEAFRDGSDAVSLYGLQDVYWCSGDVNIKFFD